MDEPNPCPSLAYSTLGGILSTISGTHRHILMKLVITHCRVHDTDLTSSRPYGPKE